MPYDGIVTRAITKELQTSLIGGRINKIYQPTNTELVFTVRNNRQNYTLLLSIHPSYARLHLTNDTYRNPNEPPMFCMLLRKHIAGAVIEHIEQHQLERIVTFEFKGFNEIGDPVTKTLIIEIMGRHSNVLLLNEDKSMIINCLKHVPPFQNRYRTLLPGSPYKLPPSQDKLNLLETNEEQFIKKLDFNAGKMDKQIVQTLTGISPLAAKEVVHRAHLGSEATYKKEFGTFQKEVIDCTFEPAIYREKKEDFHVIPISYLDHKEVYVDANEMVDIFYSTKAERDRVKQQAKDLERVVKNEVEKNERKLKIHETTIKKAKNAGTYQKYGELLTAHMHLVKKGDQSITVADYYDPDQNEVTIHLQTDKTPSENAQLFFKRYRKLSTAKGNAKVEMNKAKHEIAYLEQILQQIDTARDEDIEEIREELREQGYVKKQAQKRKRRSKPTPELFTSTDGTLIYVGRNNKQNDYVTHRIANKNDLWLHTLNIPGSHVIIKDANPSEQTLHEAAQLAAYFSKAQHSASVPVDYTEVRHVKKPSGAKPGFVTYSEQKTLYVTPDEKVVKELKARS
ncbi:NFACT family protein [Pseudogracilibacillus auburnensis]|uniref:Rqc2 homolog RqcH n=1 Tax=Pseudogracilibacillus auburnensis TaxID=1494959 RepID=A0A2V3WIC7_9BACI|nr:NFACT RNA binding domain-containing protein [Pseudogracilibacillus auburnensis]PXW88549.1 putative ribosome quality control (RQC) complex YloA/Tae2 family protein [Pseudogracilibacillus auburnensis]